MRFLTRFALNNPVVIAILVVLIAIGGILSGRQLQEELMPDISLPMLSVVTSYPGAGPEQVANDVTEPLEKAVKGLAGVDTVLSTSIANVSEVEIQLTMDANVNDVQQKVQAAVNQVKLPDGAGQPSVQDFSFDSSPILYLTVSGSHISPNKLKDVVNNTVVPALEGVSGVAKVSTAGAAADQVVMNFHPKQLKKYNLTLDEVLQDLQADDTVMPLGSTVMGGKEQPVQLASSVASLSDLRKLRIPIPPNPNAGLEKMGQGMQQLGSAVGQVASGLGQVGQGLGLVQTETQLLSSLQTVQGQLFGAELALNQELQKPANSRDPHKIAQLQAEIQGLEKTQSQLTSQLSALQKQMNTSSSAQSHTGTAVPTTPAKSATDQQSNTLKTVALSTLADIQLQPPTSGSINRTNGQPSVFIGVSKSQDANTVAVSRAVAAELAQLQSQLPSGVRVHTLFDSADMITASLNGTIREAVFGALFAVLVILLFLRSVRTTVIAIVSIPLSILIALVLLNRFHVTLNIMTLGGMAVATGRVVDDSIVVIENIHRRWRRRLGSGRELALAATAEVGRAITSSTITTVAVFLPLSLVGGLVGKIFFPFALTVVCSLLSSLLVALTVVPLMAWLLVTRRTPKSEPSPIDQEPTWRRVYRHTLNWCLEHKAVVLGLTGVALVASILVLPLAGSTFIPQTEEKFATISIQMPVGTARSETDAKARQIEDVVTRSPAVSQINTQVGGDSGEMSMSGSVSQSNQATIMLRLQPDTNVDAFLAKLRGQVKPLAGPAQIQVNSLSMGGASGSLDLIVTGPSNQAIKQAAVQITKSLSHVPGLANVTNNLTATQPQIEIHADVTKAAKYGLSAYQIGNIVKDYVGGNQVGTVQLDQTTYTVVAKLHPENRLDALKALRNLPIQTSTGQTLHLADVASVRVVQSPISVQHRDGQAYASVTGTFTGQNTGRTTQLALAKVQSLHLPHGVKTELSGDSQQKNQSFSQLIEAIVVSVGIVYLVMLITFGGWSAPFAILFSMPAALIGAFFGTVVTHQPVSVSSLIGILMLMGIVVTNAIVLVDRVEQRRREGQSIRSALLEAGATRLRPILMTAVATVCALLPLAIGFTEGALISQGLAVVVIGGLVTSTLLTLIVVPVMYELLHLRQHRRERREELPVAD
ncbi:MAG: efflux RND transporter permease subunit [Alicyclobacillus herbarius]|uniref:efflux RND transporter permease subunit n=1 Tax=Alicyclobacillus herbarius TaxID=122960 RepID=UPI002352E9C7|nr:efflux RND transporter permease subunit [Alicyclobacillus herbarius]MCL6631360.1 efflux RND transporter permease subunit [Alicyclobacillus herbarius]